MINLGTVRDLLEAHQERMDLAFRETKHIAEVLDHIGQLELADSRPEASSGDAVEEAEQHAYDRMVAGIVAELERKILVAPIADGFRIPIQSEIARLRSALNIPPTAKADVPFDLAALKAAGRKLDAQWDTPPPAAPTDDRQLTVKWFRELIDRMVSIPNLPGGMFSDSELRKIHDLGEALLDMVARGEAKRR